MGQAVTVGVALAAVGLFLAWLGAPWLLVLLEVIIVLAGAEYLSALRRAGLEPPTLLGLVAVAALPLVAYARGDAAFPMVLVLLVVFSMVWFLVGAGGGRPVRDIGTMLLAVVHVGVFGAFGALILRLGPVGGAEVDQGVSILLLAVVAAVFYDVGGLFAGSRFGRTPLSAASPNKTREGLIGGLLASVVAVLIAVFFPLFGLTTFGFVQAVVFALVCAVAAFVGDLAESLIKRDLGVKDMGDLLPGHGGVLDRFDGMLFVMPAAYYVTLVLFA
jgi:phosphatidate cytidylyltransferase